MTGAHLWARVSGNAKESAIPVQKLQKNVAPFPLNLTFSPGEKELTVPDSVFWDSY